jgi:hypothetical protein
VTQRNARIAVALGFVLSRVVFHQAGIRFDTSPLPWFWQYLDPPLLRNDLASSLWYLHAQPPLFNAFLGLGLKLGGGHAAAFFHFVHLAIGLGIALGLHDVLERVGVARRAAILVTLLYVASPTSILYEKWLMYTQLETGALVLAAWSLGRLCTRVGWRTAAPYFGAIAALALTRSLFHPLWVVACVAVALVATRPLRREVVLAGVLVLALVGGLIAKNAILFGVPSASSWFGMNLANMVFESWPLEERQQLVDQGILSPLALTAPFSPIAAYADFTAPDEGPDVPALRRPLKSGGESNYNHFAYVAIAKNYQRDTAALIRLDPARYATAVFHAWKKFAIPPSNYAFIEPNRRRILGWNRFYDMLYGVPRAWTGPRSKVDATSAPVSARDVGWSWIVLGVASLGFAAWSIADALRAERRPDTARIATIAFCLLTVGFVSVAANAVELGENNRFRAPIEPLLLVLVAFAGQAFANRLSRARAAAR